MSFNRWALFAIAIILLGGFLFAGPAQSVYADTPTETPPIGGEWCDVGLSGSDYSISGAYDLYTYAGAGFHHDIIDAFDDSNSSDWRGDEGWGPRITIGVALAQPVYIEDGAVAHVSWGGHGWPDFNLSNSDRSWSVNVVPASWETSPFSDWNTEVGGGHWVDHIEMGFYSPYTMWLSGVKIHGLCAPATTPTPTPGPSATAFLLGAQLCLTQTISTATPTIEATPTPYTNTVTPGGPTPTPGPTATPRPPSSGFSYASTADYSAGLQPWTTGANWAGYVGQPSGYHSDINGPDGRPGVAEIGMGNTYASINGYLGITQTVTSDGSSTEMLILPLPQIIDRPINITGKVRSLTPVGQAGNHIWLMMWYLDSGRYISGTLSARQWVMKPDYLTDVSYTWGTFAARIIPDAAGSGDRGQDAEAIGLSWYVTASESYWQGPETLDNALLVDDIAVTIGDQADAALPVCSGAGTSLGGGPSTKLCVVHETPVDIYATRCIQPTGIDVPAWLSFWGCHIELFFSWVDENTVQQQAMFARGARVEPVGTMAEMPQVFATLSNLVYNIGVINSRYTWANRTVDFGSLLDWHAIDTPPTLTAAAPDSSYLMGCDAVIANISNSTKAPACWVVETVRKKFSFVNLLQWALDLGALSGFLFYVYTLWIVKYG